MPRKKSSGFTLIEIMIVMVIIAMLAALVGPRVMGALGSSKVKSTKIQIETLAATVDARSAADGASGAGRGVVVFALPPNAPHAVRLSVGRLTQTVVLVVAEGRTRIERVAALASDMGAVGAAIDATILVSDRREVAFQADSDSSASRRARKVSTPVA